MEAHRRVQVVGWNKPNERENVSPFVSTKRKSTHKLLCKCLIFLALPQGLEPWTL